MPKKSQKAPISLSVADIHSKAIAPTEIERTEYRFRQFPGLVMRVTNTGLKSFWLFKRIPGSKVYHRKKLCDYPSDKTKQLAAIEHAKELAIDDLSIITKKQDPTEVKRKESHKMITFGDLYEKYMTEYARLQTKSWAEVEKSYQRYFKNDWHNRVVTTIEPIDVKQWMNRIKRAVAKNHPGDDNSLGNPTANRCFQIFRAVIRWGQKMRASDPTHDPCANVNEFVKFDRERFLQPHEWESFRNALDSEPNPIMKDFFWMCLFTGARSGNVMAMCWADINWDLQTWTIPPARQLNRPGEGTKNSRGQVVTLTPAAMKVLNDRLELRTNDYVFPARTEKGRAGSRPHMTEPKNAWKALLKRAKLYSDDKNERLCIHDLRRTVGSYMAIQGVDTKTIGKTLGHRSAASTLIYARLTQLVVRDALENMQAALGDTTRLTNPRGTKVVELQPGKKPATRKVTTVTP